MSYCPLLDHSCISTCAWFKTWEDEGKNVGKCAIPILVEVLDSLDDSVSNLAEVDHGN